MGLIVERFIQCDGCGETHGVDYRGCSSKYIRKLAKTDGWVFIKGKDYCDKCKYEDRK